MICLFDKTKRFQGFSVLQNNKFYLACHDPWSESWTVLFTIFCFFCDNDDDDDDNDDDDDDDDNDDDDDDDLTSTSVSGHAEVEV